MKAQILFFFPWVGVVLTGPARRDCGRLKSFIGTNSCGETYGGEWIECATGIFAVPTFSMPPCTPTSTPATEPSATEPSATEPSATEPSTWSDGPEKLEATTVSPESMITSAPILYETNATPSWPNATSSCIPLFICVDCLAVCGGVSSKYGDCYDACTPHSISSPECTLPPAIPTTTDSVRITDTPTTSISSAYDTTAHAVGLYEAPVRQEKPWCLVASFMCRPKGWGRRRAQN